MNGKDIGIALFSMILLSLNMVSSKVGVDHFPPFLFTALRFMSVIPFLYFFPIQGISFRTLILISLSWGILYLGGVNLALFTGVSAGVSTLVIQSSVFLTIFLSIIFFKKWPTLHQIIGTLIGFFGICIICLSASLTINGIGLLFLIVASIAFSMGTLLIKQTNSDPFSLNIWISLLSAPPMFLLSSAFEDKLWETITSATLLDWGTVLFAGWISMLLAGASWAYVVKKYDLNTVASFRLAVPVFGVAFAALLLGERYPLLIWLGAATVVGGLVIAQWSSIYHLLAMFNLRKEVQ